MKKLLSYVIILGCWLTGSLIVNNDLLLPTPFTVGFKMIQLLTTSSFYGQLAQSFGRVFIVVLLALVLALGFVLISLRRPFMRQFIGAFNDVFRTLPIAAFLILSLIWFGRQASIILVGILIVLPIIYDFLMEALVRVQLQYREVIDLYGSSLTENVRKIFLPLLKRPLLTLFKSSTLLAVKTTINAEVLAAIMNGIGYQLAYAQAQLDTVTILAYSGWLVLFSLAFSGILDWYVSRIDSRNQV